MTATKNSVTKPIRSHKPAATGPKTLKGIIELSGLTNSVAMSNEANHDE